ncbi:MAG TPA: sodium/solute symporter, partial [bacterium]|nr:sodium/solute symporter [bacterium]
FLGGRQIGPWFSAFAYGTTYFSAVIFIGFAGKLGWGFGLDVLWITLGNTLGGATLAWLILGRRTRIMSQNLTAMTMPEFLQERYAAKHLKMVAAVIIFVFLLPYAASVFKGLGHLFEANFHISYNYALLIMIFFTGVYLVLGGYFAIAMTDFVQGMVMLVGSLLMIGILVGKAGGLEATISTISANYPQHIPAAKQPSMLMIFSLVFMTSFGTWGLPQMVQKFYAIKNEKMIVKAAIVTTIFALIITFAAYFTGAMQHVFMTQPVMVEKMVDGVAKQVPDFDRNIPALLTQYLPEWLMAIILLLVLSASMSTLSSLVLVSASAIAIDLYKGHIKPEVSQKESVALMRFLSAVFIAFSYVIASYQFDIIVTLMSLSWGVVAGSFMAPYLYALYWKRTTKLGAAAGMATGLVTAIGLFYWLGPDKAPLASCIAMVLPFAVVPLVSFVTAPPPAETIRRAFDQI